MSTASTQLNEFIERVIRVEEEIAELQEARKEIYVEAKCLGFDAKALKIIVKEKRMTPEQLAALRETEAIADLYRASTRGLGGTPLGDAARRRLQEGEEARRKADETAGEDEKTNSTEGQTPLSPDDPLKKEPPELSEDEARARGKEDHAAGRRIFDNPFEAGSRLRAAWDGGWCDADGSDGMSIPDAWRRSKPKETAGAPADEAV
jgi:uncharacterized protein (UPF0335 family)